MRHASLFFLVAAFSLGINTGSAESTVIAEDDASQSAYSSSWDNGKNGGTGFGTWTMTTEGNGGDRHSGFFVASTDSNKDLNGIAKDKKAFGLYANGSGFEQAVAYRTFEKPLATGDSFSFMMENGTFEKKFEKDDATPGATGSIGLVLRSGNGNSTTADYNKDAVFEIGCYQGQPNYQVYDGSEKADTGVAFTDGGITVTFTLTGSDTYDLEIQTMSDKKLTKLPGRKVKNSGAIASFSVFDRNGEKNDAFFNQFQVSHETK
jgi:hypothetical protein